MICTNCYKQRFWKLTGKKKQDRREWVCRCGHRQLDPEPQGVEKIPKVLVFDIETSKTHFSGYRTGKQYVRAEQIEKHPYVMGWAAKWLFEPEMYSNFVTPVSARRRDDRAVIKELYKILTQADYAITYNGDNFDIKVMNVAWAKNGYGSNQFYNSIDLYKKVRQVWRLPSYSLKNVCEYFGLSPKMKREDTDEAEAGDPEALKHDEAYCRQDVFSTEDLYLFLRPWMKTHPNMASVYDMYHELEDDEIHCPRCLGVVHLWKWGRQSTNPNGTTYRATNCPHCKCVIRNKKPKHIQTRVK